MRLSRLNTTFWLVWLCAVLWCYLNAYNDPSSIFFDAERAFRRSYSAIREIEVRSFLKRTVNEPRISVSTLSRENEFLCVGIPSVNRAGSAFLETALGSLVDTLSEAERASIHVKVLLADKNPRSHFAYGARWLERLADDVLVYEYNGTDGPTPVNEPEDAYQEIPYDLRRQSRGNSRWESMQLDHSVLVEACRKHGSSYFALFEDDVIASRDWLQRVWRGIAQLELEKKPIEHGHDWLYLRAFHSEILMGWNFEETVDYMSLIVAGYAVLGLVLLLLVRYRRRPGAARQTHSKINSLLTSQNHSFNYVTSLILGLWTPACIILIFLAGRTTLHRLTTMHPGLREMPQYGCCSQGLVFPYRHLEGLENLLRQPPYDFAVDMVVEGYAAAKGFSKWALDPSVLQHIGMVDSSDEGKIKEVWNFSFEKLR